MSILALDIGTSSCKAALFSEMGELYAIEKGDYPLLFPQPGWVEQDPEQIMQGIRQAVKALTDAGNDLTKVRVISFSSQIGAQCLVNKEGKPVTNIISWMDGRAAKEAKAFTEQFPEEEIADMTGVDMVVTPAYSISKLRWLNDHWKEKMQEAWKFVQIKDYVIFQMTGNWVTDVTSMKGLVHYETLEVIPDVLDFIGIEAELLPEVKQPYEIAGYLKTEVKGFECFTSGIPVMVGWNDMNAAFLGMGALASNCVGMDLTGTSEHLGCVRSEKGTEKIDYSGLNRVPFLNGKEVFYGVTSSGGLAVEWFVKDFIGATSVKKYFEDLFEQVEKVSVASDEELIFIPYLEGERNPWNNPNIRGVFFGLNRGHKQKDMALAVLEGVCFALRAIYDRLPEFPEQVIVSGGASFNEIWNQMKADVMNVPFVRLSTTEAGCTGAAILAISELYPEKKVEEIAMEIYRPACVYYPDESRHAFYDKKYQRFLSVFHTVEPLFLQKEEGIL